jgi:predicted DNA-binding protein (MmcQ/YjbR family)
MVMKVGGKIFAIVGDEGEPLSISLKCDPIEAEALRAEFPAITPGYHLNKRHWNTIELDGSIPDDLVEDMIDASYELVVRSLPKAEREPLLKSMKG